MPEGETLGVEEPPVAVPVCGGVRLPPAIDAVALPLELPGIALALPCAAVGECRAVPVGGVLGEPIADEGEGGVLPLEDAVAAAVKVAPPLCVAEALQLPLAE